MAKKLFLFVLALLMVIWLPGCVSRQSDFLKTDMELANTEWVGSSDNVEGWKYHFNDDATEILDDFPFKKYVKQKNGFKKIMGVDTIQQWFFDAGVEVKIKVENEVMTITEIEDDETTVMTFTLKQE